MSYTNTPASEANQNLSSVFILCEEYEGDDGIRQFQILSVSNDRDYLRELMQKNIAEDPYGYVKSKGIADHRADHFETNFNDGFVEYYILEEPVHIIDRQKSPKEKPSLDEMIQEASEKRDAQLSGTHTPQKEHQPLSK